MVLVELEDPCEVEDPWVALGDDVGEDDELDPWVSVWANATTANARNIANSKLTFFISKLLSDLISNFAKMDRSGGVPRVCVAMTYVGGDYTSTLPFAGAPIHGKLRGKRRQCVQTCISPEGFSVGGRANDQ